MFTQTQTVTKKRHRHVVVAPLFVLALFLTTQTGTISRVVTASLTAASDGRVLLDGGIAAVSAPTVLRKEGDRMGIHDGTALILAEGPVSVLWNGATITGWAGAFHLVAGQSLTVSAISTPVLVVQGKAKAIIPIGMQWKFVRNLPDISTVDRKEWIAARTLLPLPTEFLGEQLKTAQELSTDATPALREPTFAILDTFLQLPAARARAELTHLQNALDPLEEVLRDGDAPAVQRILTDMNTDPADPDSALAARTPLLLGLAALHDVPVETTLYPLIKASDDLWLLSALHSKLEGAHWLLDEGADHGTESTFLRLWMLPIVDNRAQAFASTTPELWGKMLSEFLYAESDPSADAKLFLKFMNAIVANHRASGRPERAQWYAKATHTALTPFESLFTDEERVVLGSLEVSDAYLLDEPVIASSSFSSASKDPVKAESSSAMSMHPDEAVARAKADLAVMGMMFTKDTIFKPQNTAVLVSNAVLATPKGDQYFTFTYDVAAKSVHTVDEDGKAYPYALTLQQFVDWVKEEK